MVTSADNLPSRLVRLRTVELPDLSGVDRVVTDGDRHELWTADSDALVRDLVRSGVAFSELEVATASLEEAFLGLTTQGVR